MSIEIRYPDLPASAGAPKVRELIWWHPNGLFATEPYDTVADALHQKRMYERDGCTVYIEESLEAVEVFNARQAELGRSSRTDGGLRPWGSDDCPFNIEVGAAVPATP